MRNPAIPTSGVTAVGERLNRPEWAAALTGVVLGLITLAFLGSSNLRFAFLSPEIDIALHTVATLVATALATLTFVRFREQGGASTLLAASTFLLLAVANLANELVVLSGWDVPLGFALSDPGQLPLYFWAGARLLGAALLVASAIAVGERWEAVTSRPILTLVLPATLFITVCGALWLVRDSVPDLIDPDQLRRLADESVAVSGLTTINPGILILDGFATAMLLIAAFVFSRSTDEATPIPRVYLVTGLVIAAFSGLHFILYPAIYTGLVSTADVLRIVFYLVLAVGIQAGARADLQALRTANARLQVLAAAEADRTAIAERARLARELHDGLAQELWTAKLEFERFAAGVETKDPDMTARLGPTRHAIDAALGEARVAVDTLRSGFDAGTAFGDELPRHIDAFADRSGFVVDLQLDPQAARLPGVLATEILRIVDEALSNVQRHADATRIRVGARIHEGDFVLSVEDNGRGFNPAQTAPGAGLAGMRERAALIGAELVIRSAPGDGTSLQLVLPARAIGR